MSTILKALRRLEEEKSRDGSPRPLREQVASGPGEGPRRRWTSWLPVLALAVGAGLGASAWWFWPYEFERAQGDDSAAAAVAAPSAALAQTPPPVAAAPAMPAAESVVAQPSAEPESDPDAQLREMAAQLSDAPQGQPDEAFASDVEVVDRPTPSPRIEPVAAAPVARVQPDPIANPSPAPGTESPGEFSRPDITRPRATSSLTAAGGRAPENAKPSSRSQFEPKATIQPDPLQMPEPSAPVRTAASPKPSAVSAPKPAPKPAPAPASPAPAPATDVYVTRTQWHPEHARRSADVQVAGQDRSVKEGDRVGDYVVNEIKPSGVVLSRDGEQIEQKIGKPPKEARSEP